jgi:hypothetical protein
VLFGFLVLSLFVVVDSLSVMMGCGLMMPGCVVMVLARRMFHRHGSAPFNETVVREILQKDVENTVRLSRHDDSVRPARSAPRRRRAAAGRRLTRMPIVGPKKSEVLRLPAQIRLELARSRSRGCLRGQERKQVPTKLSPGIHLTGRGPIESQLTDPSARICAVEDTHSHALIQSRGVRGRRRGMTIRSRIASEHFICSGQLANGVNQLEYLEGNSNKSARDYFFSCLRLRLEHSPGRVAGWTRGA